MILTLDEYKNYLPLNSIQDLNTVISEAHEMRALYKWFPKFIGNELTELVTGSNPDEELLVKVKPVLANFTYLEALPFLNLILTGSGFAVMSNTQMAPASTDRVKTLASGLMEAAHNFLDRLLIFLEENADDYSDWNESSLNPGSLLTTADIFDEKFKINASRVTFINLIPHIKEVENLIISREISDEFLSELIAGNDTAVKPTLQSACAYWAWHRMISHSDPMEKYKDSDYVWMAKKWLVQKSESVPASKTAEEYMLKAVSYLKKHLTDYPTYQTYAYEAPYENQKENGFFFT